MIFRFGEFVLDEDQRQLLRRGSPVHLEPKAFELLGLLVRKSPKALPKQVIHDAIWPGTNVTESSLAGLVLDLRIALGDEHAEHKFIRTVRGYGYSFCAPADEDHAPPPPRWAAVVRGREIALPDGVHNVGRGEGCLVRLDSVRVSRRHARLVVSPDGVTVEDLRSRNGTWVDGRRVDGLVAVAPGAEIRLVNETIRLLAAGPDATTLTDDEDL
jgi:DNA-binding winged helix-turn-helix (wHTH) protein